MTPSNRSRDAAGLRIEPARGWRPVDLRELWDHRELLFYLVWRDIRVSYSNTGLGVFWVVLQPLSTAVIIAVVLGIFVKVPTDNLPYPVVVLSGLVPYVYFQGAVSAACASMLANAYLLSKVYFPRLIIPIVPLLVALVDNLILLAVLLGAALVFGVHVTLNWLFLPVPIALNVALALGASLWLSALNVQFRDMGRLLPVILQIGLYASPVFYLSQLVPAGWRWLYALNPMVGIIEAVRWALFGLERFPVRSLTGGILMALVLIVTGAFVFRRMEENAADVV